MNSVKRQEASAAKSVASRRGKFTLFKRAELEWIAERLQESLEAPDGQYDSFKKPTAKRDRDRNRKYRVKLKMRRAMVDAAKFQAIQHAFSVDEWEYMFPGVALGLMVKTKVYRCGDEEAIHLALCIELGLKQRLRVELGKDAELVSVEVPVIKRRRAEKFPERAVVSILKERMRNGSGQSKPQS